MSFRRILVGVDLELRDLSTADGLPKPSRQLFEQAVDWAGSQRAELRLVAVLDGPNLTRTPTTAPQVTAFVALMGERLESLIEQAQEAGIDCSAELIGGDPVEVLLQECDELQPQLLMLGAGRHPLRLGRTAQRVVQSASCPVYVARAFDELCLNESESEPDSDADPQPPVVLIANDLRDHWQMDLLNFVSCGLWRDAKCWLLHVEEPPHWPEAWQAGISADDLASWQAHRVESARSRLHEHLSVTDHRTMTYGILTDVVEGDAVETVLRRIDEQQINLLVCGARFPALGDVRCSVLTFPGSVARRSAS